MAFLVLDRRCEIQDMEDIRRSGESRAAVGRASVKSLRGSSTIRI